MKLRTMLEQATEHTHSNFLRKTVIGVFLVTGAALMVNGGYIQLKALLGQWLINKAWHESSSVHQQKPWPWMDSWPVAKIHIPRLNIQQVILEGDSGQSLAFGPGHRLTSAMPGEQGTMLVSGHRDTHFRFLQKLQPDDEIRLVTPDGTAHFYQVETMDVLNADDSLISDPTEHFLVLATCWPFDQLTPTDQRYVVVARQRRSLTAGKIRQDSGSDLG